MTRIERITTRIEEDGEYNGRYRSNPLTIWREDDYEYGFVYRMRVAPRVFRTWEGRAMTYEGIVRACDKLLTMEGAED
jgi:hypothetical protein